MYRRDDAIILFNITLNSAKILHLSHSSLLLFFPAQTGSIASRINSQSRSTDTKKAVILSCRT